MHVIIADPGLPRLAWIAEYKPENHKLTVHHGRDVEVGDGYVVEGTWDGNFENLDFHTSNHFFGSGIKIKEHEIIVTPSTGLVDRIFVGQTKTKYFISNSIIEILASTNSKLIPDHNYKSQTSTIQSGIKKYKNEYPIESNILLSLSQYFYHPITISQRGLNLKNRDSIYKFSSYEEYISKIKNDLNEIFLNARSPNRRKPIDIYTTISKGYDSTAVSALTASLPIKAAFTSRKSNSSALGLLFKDWDDDDGSEIAKILGLNVAYLDYKASEIDYDELYFLAATTGEPELQFYKLHNLLTNSDSPNLIFTGYHGDTVWALSPSNEALTDDIIKPGSSGLSLSEARLKSGFIDVPVPMMFARSIVSINQLSISSEMSKWSVGGDYDRPIPRRILEEQGVERTAFGMRKKAVATFYDLPKNKKLREEFLEYMKSTYKKSHASIIMYSFSDRVRYYSKMLFHIIDKFSLKTGKFERPLNAHSIDTPYHMHIWSLTKLVEARRIELDT